MYTYGKSKYFFAETQKSSIEVGSTYTPVRSNAGVYSSRAEVRSWVKPSWMPQFSI